MANIALELLNNVVELTMRFTDVALSDPLSALLLTMGALLTGFSVLVIGYLALGAVGDALVGDLTQGPPQQGR
ncbi:MULTISPECIES: hypothetical protein [unclassified Haladaptatus]|uniref:hypothetical protein n=1 Tax=unclassified Haladaptatus TaxID=2622732 RepID=UPI0023E8DD56|nr:MULTISPECIES: hypothetical protein [unclassified Haladaptatus]